MSWFSKVFSWFKKAALNTNWAHTASAGLALAGPPAILIVQETLGTDAAAEGQEILNETTTDLGILSGLLAQAQSDTNNPSRNAQIVAILGTVKDNFGKILSMSHVKNSANAQKATAIVNALVSEVDAIISMIPDKTVAAPVPTPPPTK